MSRLIIPRQNYASSFNFFLKNTKKGLFLEQNFIANHFLLVRHCRNSPTLGNRSKHISQETGSTGAKARVGVGASTNATGTSLTGAGTGVGEEDKILNVASKVLNCHDDDHAHVPFKVVGKPRVGNNSQENNTKKPISLSDINTQKKLKQFISPYIKLTKPRLTVLVSLSSICSYALSPNTVALPELAFLLIGTTLASGAANAINMGREPKFDSQMVRTSRRPVVTGALTPVQAYRFAALSGTIGCLVLLLGVNPTVASLGFLNIVLYSWIYTSLKRKHIINTWVGAIVGAIPPLMGWAVSSSLLHPGAWCLAALLYAWQFPHFNSLSHNIADQYKSAGYVMTAAENPKLNARVALRYSLLMFPICFGLSYFGVTDWVFAVDSSIANGFMAYGAYLFWNQQRKNYAKGTIPTAQGLSMANIYAKKLFWCSVWQLPVVLILAMLHKKGQWDRLLDYMGFRNVNSKEEKLLI